MDLFFLLNSNFFFLRRALRKWFEAVFLVGAVILMLSDVLQQFKRTFIAYTFDKLLEASPQAHCSNRPAHTHPIEIDSVLQQKLRHRPKKMCTSSVID